MLSNVSMNYSTNFTGFNKNLGTKFVKDGAKELDSHFIIRKKGPVLAATALASLVVKPVSNLSVGEMYKEYDNIPDNSNYMTDAEKQRAAELTGRMTKLGLLVHGQIDENKLESYNKFKEDNRKLMDNISKKYPDISEPAYLKNLTIKISRNGNNG